MSLGERAYVAYWRRWPATPLPWHCLSGRERAAWEAAARAAVAAARSARAQEVGGRCPRQYPSR